MQKLNEFGDQMNVVRFVSNLKYHLQYDERYRWIIIFGFYLQTIRLICSRQD